MKRALYNPPGVQHAPGGVHPPGAQLSLQFRPGNGKLGFQYLGLGFDIHGCLYELGVL